MAVTKEKIITDVFENTDLSRKDARAAVEKVMEILKRTLAEEKDVLISGFGKFVVKRKRARRGRNPQTRESLELRSRRVVVFKNSGILRKKVNGEIVDDQAVDGF
ncbi:MAG: integration host factor subunit alpha [Candidatus Adiutrix sp.]|jgi:integration host factor subunit alpha|nr:integration host factor subunit alpha [Candidatus Adiutrix sp.]